jgi:hypothetical protein
MVAIRIEDVVISMISRKQTKKKMEILQNLMRKKEKEEKKETERTKNEHTQQNDNVHDLFCHHCQILIPCRLHRKTRSACRC